MDDKLHGSHWAFQVEYSLETDGLGFYLHSIESELFVIEQPW